MSNTSGIPAFDQISDSAALLDLSRMLNASVSLEFILANVLLTCMGKLLVSRSLVMVQGTDGVFSVGSAKGLRPDCSESTFRIEEVWSGVRMVQQLHESSDEGTRTFAEYCEDCGLHVLIPMELEDRMVGILAFGRSFTDREYSSSDLTFLASVAAVAATAVHTAVIIDSLRVLNRQLDAKVQEMNTLFELSREMNRTFDEQMVLRLLSYALMGQLRVMRFVVFAMNGPDLEPTLVKLPDFCAMPEYQKEMLSLDHTVIFTERDPDIPYQCWLRESGLQVLIPMRTQNETRGVLCLGERMGSSGYSDTEIEYLSGLANITITALENTRLIGQMIEKQRLEQQLEVARNIQNGLLPKTLPIVEGYNIAAVNDSSLQIGGDYYDVLQISPHEYVLAIGDVSGKGIPASLLMANVQAALRTIAPLRLPLPEATARINSLIHSNTGMDKFITFFWGILDTSAHTFTYVNAGHNPPHLLRRDGRREELCEGGLILGVLSEPSPYSSATISLEQDDVVFAFTDGVSEAMSKDQEEYGDARLADLAMELRNRPAEEFIEEIRSSVRQFSVDAAQSDDITMLVFRRVH